MSKYVPLTEKQLKLLCWWKKESPYSNCNGIICDGAVRSGKSLFMSLSYVFWAFEHYNNRNFGIAGKSVSSIRRNVIDDLKQRLIPRGYIVEDRRTENKLIIHKGNIVNNFYVFGGKDERSRDFVQGFTAAGFYFDEVTLMPRSFVEQCMARCSVEGAKYWFNCNPEGPSHWFKLEYIDKLKELNLYRIQFKLTDNPSLSNETINRYKSMFTGVFHKRFVDGEWVVADGIIYDSFDSNKNVYDELPVHVKEQIKPVYGADYGTFNPMVFLECYIDRHENTLYIDRECFYDGRESNKNKTDSEYVQDYIAFKNPNTNMLIVDPSAASFIIACRKNGLFVKKANNDVLEGISAVHSLIGVGRLKINKNCKNTLREIATYSWDDKKAANGKEQPIKVNDHAMDALRYIVNTALLKSEIYR